MAGFTDPEEALAVVNAPSTVVTDVMAFDCPVRTEDEDGSSYVVWPRLVIAQHVETGRILGINILGEPADKDLEAADQLVAGLGHPKRIVHAPYAAAPQRMVERTLRKLRENLVNRCPSIGRGLSHNCVAASKGALGYEEFAALVDEYVREHNAGLDDPGRGEAETAGRAAYNGQSKPLGRAPLDMIGQTLIQTVAGEPVAVEVPILAPRAIPTDRLEELAGLSTEPMTAAERIALIRETARLASELRQAAEDYYRISHELGTDAIAFEAGSIADSFSEAAEDAVSTLLLLISAGDSPADMDEITDRCAFLEGGA